MSSYAEIAQNWLKTAMEPVGSENDPHSTEAVAQTLSNMPPDQAAQIAQQALANTQPQPMTQAAPQPLTPGTELPTIPSSVATPIALQPPPGSVPAPLPGAVDPMAEQLNRDRAHSQSLEAEATRDASAYAADVDAAQAYQLAGEEQKVAAESAGRDQQAAIKEDELQGAMELHNAQKQLDGWHVTQEQEIQTGMIQIREQMQALAAKNPEDLWGNWSTSQKVAGVIGLIGAGFAHDNAAQRVDQLINQAVQANQNKMKAWQLIGHQQDNIAAQSEAVFKSKQAGILNQKAELTEIFGKQLELAALKMQNPVAQANLTAAHGIAIQKSAELKQAASIEEKKERLNALQQQVQISGIEAQRLNAMQAKATTAAAIKQQQREREGALQGFTDDSYMDPVDRKKFVQMQGKAHSLIDNVDRAKDLLTQITEQEKHGTIDPDLVAEYSALRDGALPAWRIYTESGARLEAGEEKKFEKLFPSIARTLLGGYSILGGESGLDESRDIIVNSIKRSGEALAPKTARFNPDYELYRPSSQRAAEQAKKRNSKRHADDVAAQARARAQPNG